jgi:hypothetical protein
MIGATDIVVMAQRMSQTPHEATSPRQSEKELEGAGLFQWREVRQRVARVSRMQVVRGRVGPRPEDPGLWFWVSIVEYETDFKGFNRCINSRFSPAQQEQEEFAVSARYSDESIGSVTPRCEENLGKCFVFPARHCPTSQTRPYRNSSGHIIMIMKGPLLSLRLP